MTCICITLISEKDNSFTVAKNCGVHWAVSEDHLGAVLSHSLLNSVPLG